MSTVRYKFIKNQTTTPLTIDNFASNCMLKNDGDDRQEKFVKRVITIADIGGDPGELGDPYGAILDIIPPGYNVLWFQADVYRPGDVKQQGSTYYNNIVSDITPLSLPAVPATITQTTLNFLLGQDNSLRINDKGWQTASSIQEGDIITAKIIIGYSQFPTDVMNP